jgi:plastocyanin
MRVTHFALACSVTLFACGGADRAADTAADTGAAVTPGPAPAPTGTATAAPITGTTHQVQMVIQGTSYLFVPANLTVRSGDGIRFINVSGGPHNVAFDPAAIPANVKPQLAANMPDQALGELSGRLLTQPNESYTISFANIPAGTYPIFCTPHLAMGMRGQVTVQ